EAEIPIWLGEVPASPEEIGAVLRPYEDEGRWDMAPSDGAGQKRKSVPPGRTTCSDSMGAAARPAIQQERGALFGGQLAAGMIGSYRPGGMEAVFLQASVLLPGR
ncbi:MAG: hypothetical protein WEA77_13120, partial [Hyphomonas sp.]|uniref:hypothetical protein n=1 Tax=Hyphomonas sp. TaxID=87 RepID=UPI00349FD740